MGMSRVIVLCCDPGDFVSTYVHFLVLSDKK